MGTAPLRTVSEMLNSTSTTNQPALNRTLKKTLQYPDHRLAATSAIAEMPKNEGDFVRLFFSDPHAVFNLVQSAASRLNTVSPLVCEPMTGKPASKLCKTLTDASHRPQASLSTTRASMRSQVMHAEAVTRMRRKRRLHSAFDVGSIERCICMP
jgi:hypothetical protein